LFITYLTLTVPDTPFQKCPDQSASASSTGFTKLNYAYIAEESGRLSFEQVKLILEHGNYFRNGKGIKNNQKLAVSFLRKCLLFRSNKGG
jgi:hypothetical protein